jgi:hypothetical protein
VAVELRRGPQVLGSGRKLGSPFAFVVHSLVADANLAETFFAFEGLFAFSSRVIILKVAVWIPMP